MLVNKLQIKGMVCTRCISILFNELSLIGLEITSITLGEVFFKGELPKNINDFELNNILQKYNFELLNDKKQQTVASIKSLVEKSIQLQLENKGHIKFSELISDALNKDYNFLSALFSEQEGITLEKYIIKHRISAVQELLINTEKSLTQISDELGYSSVSHLSRQLKSYSGYDAYHYKDIRKKILLSL